MDEDAERNALRERNANALRQVLRERCPDVQMIITDDDINNLVNAGFITAAILAAATKDDLYAALPGRGGVVGLLSKAFVQPAGLSSGVPEKLLQDLTEFLAEQKAKQKSKKSVCSSSVNQYIWDNLQRQEGLKLIHKAIDSKRLSDLPAFGWDDRLEKAQADRYISQAT